LTYVLKTISIFTKIRPVGGEVFHVNRGTDMTKLADALSNFVNVPKKE